MGINTYGKVCLKLYSFGLTTKMRQLTMLKSKTSCEQNWLSWTTLNLQQPYKFYCHDMVITILRSEKRYKLFCLSWHVLIQGRALGGYSISFISMKKQTAITRKRIATQFLVGTLQRNFLAKLLVLMKRLPIGFLKVRRSSLNWRN